MNKNLELDSAEILTLRKALLFYSQQLHEFKNDSTNKLPQLFADVIEEKLYIVGHIEQKLNALYDN